MVALFGLVVLALSQVVCEPGCSFSDNQCIYNVRLDKQGHCQDQKATTGTSDESTCCGNLKVDISDLQKDFNDLARTFSGIHDNSQSDTPLTSSQTASAPTANEQHLMQILAQKEAELKKSQTLLDQKRAILQSISASLLQKEHDVNASNVILSQVSVHSLNEIRRLKGLLVTVTTDLNNCRGATALNTGNYQHNNTKTTPYNLTYCFFEGPYICGYRQNRDNQDKWLQIRGSRSATTGPLEDHTYGSPKGHYMAINPSAKMTTETNHTARMTSLPFSPAPSYCIRFWYNMYGVDIRTLNVYAKVGSGYGYPVWTSSGAHGHDWHLGEISLDSEYALNSFSVVFEANHEAYYTITNSAYDNHTTVQHGANANIAIDDVYVYDVACKTVPTCIPGSSVWSGNGSSSCYTFHTTPEDWYTSQTNCHKEGATSHLVSVNSKDEQQYLVNMVRNNAGFTAAGSYGWYTSGNDEREEQHFDWTDTGTPYMSKYTDWHAGQPNNVGNQNCLLLQYADSNYEWGDVNCDERHPYICEVEIPTV